HTNDGMAPPNTGPGDFPGGEIRGQLRVAGEDDCSGEVLPGRVVIEGRVVRDADPFGDRALRLESVTVDGGDSEHADAASGEEELLRGPQALEGDGDLSNPELLRPRDLEDRGPGHSRERPLVGRRGPQPAIFRQEHVPRGRLDDA